VIRPVVKHVIPDSKGNEAPGMNDGSKMGNGTVSRETDVTESLFWDEEFVCCSLVTFQGLWYPAREGTSKECHSGNAIGKYCIWIVYDSK